MMFEQQLETLRVFKQTNLLRVAASDITNVLPLMKVSDHLSDIAEVILSEAVDMSWRYLGSQTGGLRIGLWFRSGPGVSACRRQGTNHRRPAPHRQRPIFFPSGPAGHPCPDHPYPGRPYLRDRHAAAPQRQIPVCSSAISKPSGNTSSKDAWTWEHQALIRARAVTGDAAVQDKFATKFAKEVLCQARREPAA
jgi:glutamate-ammonia-ligase adenylyltransferase